MATISRSLGVRARAPAQPPQQHDNTHVSAYIQASLQYVCAIYYLLVLIVVHVQTNE